MKIFKSILVGGILVGSFSVLNAQDGAQLFKANCASCHSIGKGRLVGPDLQDVQSRHSEEWLERWVKSSQTMVKAGDGDAVKLFDEYNKVPMPDAVINDGEIKSVLAYIKTKSTENATASSQPAPSVQAGVAPAGEVKPAGTLLNQFSTADYVLGILSLLLLIIIWLMSKTIKSLSLELERKYSSDDSQ